MAFAAALLVAATLPTLDTGGWQPRMEDLTMAPGGACSSTSVAVNRTPQLRAVLTAPGKFDDITSPEISAEFKVSWAGGSWSTLIGEQASGSTFTVTPPSTVPENVSAQWGVRAFDGTSYGPWSWAGRATPCYFQLDTTRPAAPTVSSATYPDGDEWLDGVGRYGDFTFRSASDDVVRYEYQLDSGPTATVKPAAPGLPVEIRLAPERVGPNLLTVRALDAAGNYSVETTHSFRVRSGTSANAGWALDDPSGSAQVNDTAGKLPASVTGGATLGVPGVSGTAMRLDGVDGHAATTGPAVDTTKTFAVSAWAKLPATKPDHRAVVVAQAGTRRSGFELSYVPGDSGQDHWAFSRYESDTAGAASVSAVSTSAPRAGQWAHLAGVYDPVKQTLALYVNGERAQTAAYTKPWNATGPVRIGAGAGGPAPVDFFAGDIDDVRVFDRLITAEEISTLATRAPKVEARWMLNESADGVTADDGPNGLHATLGGDAHAEPDAGWVGDGGLVLDGDGDYVETAGPVVQTDGSFSVTGWVNPADWPTENATIFSQAGEVNSGFILRYAAGAPDEDGFPQGVYQIEMPGADEAGAQRQTADNPWFQLAGRWDHVAIVYDASAGEMRLYVNGQLSQTVDGQGSWRSGTTGFDANGAFQIGRSKSGGVWGEYWPGAIDDVWAFSGALEREQIQSLAAGVELPTVPGP